MPQAGNTDFGDRGRFVPLKVGYGFTIKCDGLRTDGQMDCRGEVASHGHTAIAALPPADGQLDGLSGCLAGQTRLCEFAFSVAETCAVIFVQSEGAVSCRIDE